MPSRRQLLAGVGSAGATALAGCTGGSADDFSPGTDPDADWPMARFDPTNTAYSPDAKAPREGVRERWTFEDGTASGAPAVSDGTVYLPTSEALVALDSATGEESWRFSPTEYSPWPRSPVVHEGFVYVTAVDENGVYALDANSGEEVWSISDVGHVHARPHLLAGEHVSNPVVYAGTENGRLLRLDAKTGEITWRTDLFGTVSAFGYRLPHLYVGTESGEVYSFSDSVDGVESPDEMWRRKIGSAVRSILPDEECTLVQTFGGPLRCLQGGAHAGTTRWSVDSKWANAAPVSAQDTFFTAGYRGLAAFREHDRKVEWRYRGRFDSTGPVAAGDTLYVSDGEGVHAFALGGGVGAFGVRFDAKRWLHPTPAGAVEGLAVADGALFAACEGSKEDDTTLYCLESPK